MADNINKKLFPYQIEHTKSLMYSLKKYNRGLDSSDTGTGKSYTTIAICQLLDLEPFIICPKSVISSWKTVLKYFDVLHYGITNYESLQNCKYYTHNSKNEKVKCPFISRVTVASDSNKDKIEYTYVWKNLPKNMVLIFDEAHRCKNSKTLNNILLYTAAQTTAKILIISATIADKPENFALGGYVLRLYKSIKDAHNWMVSVGKNYDNIMQGIHDVLYPEYASRMKIRDLGKLFPENQIVAKCYDMDYAEEIEKQYAIIQQEVERLKNKEENSGNVLARILYARMKIEQLKIPTIMELAKKYLEENSAVAIFVNFTTTLKALAEELKTNCLIYGEQPIEERNKNIECFNQDKSQIIICNIRSGGTGISLHDQNGSYPRVSIISPSWSAQDIIQVLGRIHRANTKSIARQRIIYCKGTIEEKICNNVKDKIKNIAQLNDGDMLSYQIEGLTKSDDDDNLPGDSKLTEFEKIFQRINVLNIKKDRIKKELAETEDEIKTLELVMNSFL